MPRRWSRSLLQHALAIPPDLDGVASATATLIGRATAMLAEVEREGASVANAAELATRLYELIDDGLADPGRQMAEGADGAPPEGCPGRGRRGPAPRSDPGRRRRRGLRVARDAALHDAR